MPRILHLGLGAFHRAHQAAVLQRLHDAGDRSWTLAAGNLRDDQRALERALLAQDGAYTLETVAPDGQRRYQRIEAIARVLPFESGHAALVALGADPDTRIVACTVTEAGYCLGADGAVDANDTAFCLDVALHQHGRVGNTLYGVLAAIAAARRRSGAGAFTVLCCDNLRHNGARLREGLRRFLAAAGDAPLRGWLDQHARFPDTMVDRITPRPGPEVQARVRAATGRDDAAAVMAEDFLQWVVQDDFAAGRPAWESAGVELVADVAPWEEAKLRILNAGHSLLAWGGALRGHAFVHEAAGDAPLRRALHDHATGAVLPCLLPSPLDLMAYRDTVLARFGNAALADGLGRIAADSFAKFPGFHAPTLRERLRAGAPLADAVLPAALLLAFLQRWNAGALPFEYRDQAASPAELRALCGAADPVAALCAQTALFGQDAGNARLVAAVRAAGERVAALAAAP